MTDWTKIIDDTRRKLVGENYDTEEIACQAIERAFKIRVATRMIEQVEAERQALIERMVPRLAPPRHPNGTLSYEDQWPNVVSDLEQERYAGLVQREVA